MIVLQTIFMPKSDATRSVWRAFENYVVLWYMLYISSGVLGGGIRRIPTSGVFLTTYTHLSDHK